MSDMYARQAGRGADFAPPGERDQVEPTRLHELSYELVLRCPGIGRTKLAKLLYLVDLEHFCLRGVTLTGAAYVRRQRGPMPVALYDVERDLDGWALRVTSEQVGPTHVEIKHWAIEGKLQPSFDAREREIIDLIASTYSPLPLKDLLRVVYDTEPMRSILAIERDSASSLVGKPIDLSSCWSSDESQRDEESAEIDETIASVHLGETVERESERLATISLAGGRAT